MARRKRNSTTLAQSERRLESLRSIHETLDLGSGIDLATYTDLITDLRTKLAAYNTALSRLDSLADEVKQAERAAKQMSEKLLLGVGSRYGKNSREYEMAGGSRRKSSRRATVSSDSATVAARSIPLNTVNGSKNGASSNGASLIRS